MLRDLQPEILDSLPPDHPSALASRRDIQMINRVMGNHQWIQEVLNSELAPDESVLEIGAGCGALGFSLQTEIARYAGLDLAPRPPLWPQNWAWHQADLLTSDEYKNYPVVVANLVLHHFNEAQLRQLGQKFSETRVIIASETVRRPLHQWQLKLLWFAGINRVTRHDGHVSIAAGFLNHELPTILGLSSDRWDVSVHSTLRGSYRMIAVRR